MRTTRLPGRPWTVLGLSALLALSLTACGGGDTNQPDATTPTTPDTSASDTNRDSSGSADAAQTAATEDISLTTFRDTLKSGGYFCGVAYLGNTSNGATVDALLDEGGYLEDYPFLKNFPETQTVHTEGDEVYCIVPRDHGATVTVQTWTTDERGEGKAGETLYEGEGVPVILTCNVSDILPNLLVTVTSNGETWAYNPSLSLCDGSLVLPASPKLYDFSRYQTPDTTVNADFLGSWQGDTTTLSFSDDGTMTYTDDVTHRGTFYIIETSSRYPAGSVQFEWDQDGDEAFWGVFTLTRDGSKLTVTNITGNSIKEDTFHAVN